ncbi:hypothetical protein DSO57_1009038 [Entomophthora muscae]|uniref:Uncharacterized protein n=1 Tax=Entomophthora muscae TaxID=34485 RepID=A0ACC2URY4_9FUNG|nr:hypothetical protein DSO57_1009038 [Entomophthora muscae]
MTEIYHLLGLHSIFIAFCTAQIWMHVLVVSVLALTNQLADELDDGSNFPHDTIIGATITGNCVIDSLVIDSLVLETIVK